MTKAEKAVQMILPEVAGRVVLEIACGCAEFSLSAAKHAKQVVCIDLDDRRLGPAVPMQSNITFFQMDATQMQLADDTFDTVVIYNALAHLEQELARVLAECGRIVKDGGKIFLISSWKIDKTMLRRCVSAMKAGSVTEYGDFLVAEICGFDDRERKR